MPPWRDIPWSLTEVTAPAVEPVSLTEVKNRLRISGTADDSDLQLLILAARKQVERDTNESLVKTVWDLSIDAFPSEREIVVPRAPLVSVASVTSYDEDDAATVFASSSYRVDTASKPGRIVLNASKAWPSDLRLRNAGVVRFTAGYSGSAKTVSSITRSGTTATVTTAVAHGYATGQRIMIAGADQASYNGTIEITVTGAATFTYTVSGSPATPATGVMTATNLGIPESRTLAMLALIGHWWDRVRTGLVVGQGESSEELPLAYSALIGDRAMSLG